MLKRFMTVLSFIVLGLFITFNTNSVFAFDEDSVEISDQLLTRRVVHVETMYEAYQVFKEIYPELTFMDIADIESQGSSFSEVEALIDVDKETDSYEIMENITVLYYVFESEEVFEELDDAPKSSDLVFLFADDQLIGVSILSHSFYLDIYDNGYSWEEIQEYIDNDVNLDDMRIYRDSILSYAYVKDAGDDFHAVNVFTLDDEENQYIENFIFYEEAFVNSYYYELDDSTFLETNLFGLIDVLQPEFWSQFETSAKDKYLGTRETFIETGEFYSQAMDQAYEDYVQIVENFRLVDLNLWEQGTLQEEFIDSFQTKADYEILEGIEGAEVVSYLYDDAATLDVYFVDEFLVYMGANNIDLKFEDFNFISSRDFDLIGLGPIEEDLAEESLPILAYGSLNFNAQPIQTIAIGVQQFGDIYEGLLLIADGQILDKKLVIRQSENELSVHDKMILMAQQYLSE